MVNKQFLVSQPVYHVLESPRVSEFRSPRVLASSRPRVLASPRPHVPASRGPTSPSRRVPRPQVASSHVPRPRPTFSDSPYFQRRESGSPESGETSQENSQLTPLGVNGCLNRACYFLYWPGMEGDIKNHVSTCEACRDYE